MFEVAENNEQVLGAKIKVIGVGGGAALRRGAVPCGVGLIIGDRHIVEPGEIQHVANAAIGVICGVLGQLFEGFAPGNNNVLIARLRTVDPKFIVTAATMRGIGGADQEIIIKIVALNDANSGF